MGRRRSGAAGPAQAGRAGPGPGPGPGPGTTLAQWAHGCLGHLDQIHIVPLPRPDDPALDRLSQREHFADDEDFVFIDDVGSIIEGSALRRRMYAARKPPA